jgi:hypothetical protein
MSACSVSSRTMSGARSTLLKRACNAASQSCVGDPFMSVPCVLAFRDCQRPACGACETPKVED